MATQADVPEVIPHKRLEVEDTSLTNVQFEKAVDETFLVEVRKYESVLNEYPETQESQAESENKQVACNTQVEITDNLVNGNSGTSEGGIVLASLSGSAISSKEASGQEDFQVDEHTQSEVEISETAKHLEKGQQFEAVKETARKDEVVEEKNGEPDQVEKNLGQNEEAILNQKDSVDEGFGSAEKEIKDLEKDEKEGEMEESQAQLSSKEIPCIPEVTLDHKNVQSVAVTCPEEENMDNMSSTETILLKKEFTEERSLEETKEEGECVDLATNGKGSEEICSSENKGNEDEKNQITHDNVGNATLSTTSLNREESQNNETGESVKDEIERVIVTDELGDQEAGIAEKEKHEEVSGPASSEEANDLSRQEKDKVPVKNEVRDKDNSVTLFVAKAEEACLQEKDNPEILKESSKIELDYNAKETPIDVTKQTEILEETTQVKGTASGYINGHENSEQELGISSRKPDEEIHGKDEGLDTTEAAVEEAQNMEASSLVAAEDINGVKLIQAEELTEAESTKHEDQPDDNLLPQNETEEEKFQTHFSVVSEGTKSVALRGDATTVTSIKEEGEIKSLEESFEESEEITNLPLTHSDKKTESTEAEFPNNDANNSKAAYLLVEQAEAQGEKINEVSKLESHENDQASDETLAKEEKHAEAESEGYQITEKAFVTSTEERPPTGTIVNVHENTEEPEKDCGVRSKESLASQDAGENELEKKKVEAEVTDLDLQKFTSSQESEESSTLDDIPTNVENTVGKIPKEEASKLTSEDESHKQEGKAADFEREQISERDIVFSIPEMIKEGTSKSFEGNLKDAVELSEAEIPTEIIKGGNINDLTLEKIQEDATDVLKDHEHEAEKSKEEVLEELETVEAGENIPYETKNIEKIVDAPSVEQEEVQHEEGKFLDRAEASIEEDKVEIAVEEALKSRGEDEVHKHENMEENVNQEQTIEKDATFSTPESVQEATSEGSQDNIKAVENLNKEESTVQIIKEDKLDDLSPENTQEDGTKTLEDRENEVEKSKEKIVDDLEMARAGESISCETNKDVECFVDASSVQQEVKDQDQGPIKAPTEENKVEIVEEEALKSKHEEESHKQEAESNKEQIIKEGVTFSAAESTQEEKSKTSQENVKYAVKLNEEESTVERLPENKQGDEIQLNDHENEAEKCIEGVVQESDTSGPTESISFETNKDGEKIVDASSIKQEEGQQEEGKYQDPNKASMEENKVETPKEEGQKSKDEAENHEQESTAADFDKEQILEEDTFSTLESIQEETSKSSQDNRNDAEKINEEHPAETAKEGNTNNLLPENIQGDAIEVLKDHENEVEKSEKEVVEELETAGLGESIPCKTNKDVEKFEDASSVKQDEGQQEQGKYLDPTGALIEENKREDEASKSRGDDRSYRQESTEADFNKEQIVEREVTFCTSKLIQEETSKTSQVDVKDAERNDEESTTKRTKVGKTNDLSGENIQGDTVETLKDHENEEEKSTEEVVEELEAAKENESISCETNKGVESYVDASSVKQEEGRQEEGKYTDPNGALIEENKVEIPEKEALKLRGEDESHRQESTEEDFKKEHFVVEEVTFSTPESTQHETSESSQDNIKDAEKINEESTIEITKEGNTNDHSQENIQENAVETSKEEHENEVGKSKEEVAQELETTGPSESIPFETKKDVEKTVDTSSVRQEEALTEENKFKDKFSTEVVKNFDENEVTATEREIELASKRKEDQQQVMQEDKPEETLEDLLDVTTEATKTEKSSEMDRELTCVEVERSIQNLNETAETKKEEEKSKNMDTDESKKEIPKELETAEASESSPCDINEDAESSIDDSSVKQEEGPKEEVKYIDQVKASTEENKFVETVAAGVVKDDEENRVLDASSKGKEDQQQATHKDEPEEKLENLISVTPEEIETETTNENARSITSLEVEGTSQNLEETFETEETKYMEDTNASEKISKELETPASGESIPRKTNEDIEHSVDSSSINQEDQIQQEEAKYLHQVDASIEENKFVDTYSTEVVKEDDDNIVEVAEKRIEVASNDKEDQQQATTKDEPGEKLEVTLVETETEPPSEIAREITSAKVEGTVQNIDKTVETANEEEQRENTDSTNESEKEIPKELETTGARKSVSCKINEDAESSFDASSVKQEESQKEEVKYIDQVQASIGENKLEETSTSELVKVDDDNKVSNVASKAEEDQQQRTQKDKPDEKLENLHHVTPEETEIETSAENATNNTCVGVAIIAQNLEETLKKEKIEHADSITVSEKEITQEFETVGTDESIPCKTNEEVRGSVVTLSVKQDGQHEEDKELDQIDALKEENKVEDSSSAEVGKQDDDSNFDVTKKEIEEDQQPAMPKDEPEQKLEDLLQATPKETEAETSSRDAINITCVEREGTVQDVEENSEIENKEENMKNADDANYSETKVLDNTSAGQETTEEVSREIVGESSKEVEMEEDGSSGSKEQTEMSDLIVDIKPESLQYSAKPNEELYTTTTREALEEEKLAEEETQEREVAVHGGTDFGSAGILAEETSVKEAKPDDKEEVQSYKVYLSEKGSKNNQVESESVLTENLSGETGLKEGELDNEEQHVAPEDGLKSIAGSVLTDIVSEKTFLKEVKRDVEEKIETSDDALIDKGLESNGDPVSTENLSEETLLKEAKPDDEQQIKKSDAVSEEKLVSGSADVGLELDSVTTESSFDTSLVTQEESQQEQVKYIDQARASIEENKLEETFTTEVVKVEDDNKISNIASKSEEDQQQAAQKDKREEKLETLLHVTPEETETETSTENAKNISCMGVERISRNVEETSEKEKIEHVDSTNDSEKEVIEITSAGEETKEEVSRDIVEESSKEVEKEGNNSWESKEQNKVADLIEEIKPESLEDSARLNEDLYAKTTTEAPEEEKLAEEEMQKKEPISHDGTNSGSSGILAEETSMMEAKLDEEEVKSYDIAPEDKGVTSIAGSVSTEIASEKTLLKEVKTDDEEKIKISDNALQEKDLESSGDPVSTEIVSKETCPKEAKPDDEEQIKNSDAVSEEKGVSSSADVGLELDSVSTESTFDASLVKKEETQQEEVKYIDQAQASNEENKLVETFTAEVVKVDDDNKVSNVASRGEEDQPQATQKDTPDEKLENLLLVTPEEAETETSTENATNITCVGVERIAPNLEETSEKDKSEPVHGINDSAKEIPRELETARTDESTPCKSNEDVERSVANLLVKQEGHYEEDKELDQIDALKEENKVEDSQDDENKVEVTKREIEEDQQPAMPKDEPEQKLEDLLQVTPKETEAGTSSGDAIDITCMEGEGTIQDVEETSEVGKKEENMKNTDDANEIEKEVIESASAGHKTQEEVSRDVVEESSKEVEKEEDKSSESKEDNEAADFIEKINPESLEDSAKPNEDLYTKTTTEAPEEEKLAEEEIQEKEPIVHDGTDPGSAGILVEETSMTEAKPDEEELRSYDIAPEDTGLISIAGSLSTGIVSKETYTTEAKTDVEEKIRSSDDAFEEKGPESGGDPTSTEIVLKTTSESQETPLVSRQIVEESSKEVEKEEDKSSESREQNEVVTLIEDIKPKSLQESAKKNEEFYATTTTEAPEEEKLAEEETQEIEPVIHNGADSGSAGILVKETSVMKAKPDEEEIRSYDIAPEDKGLTSIAGSVSTEIVCEEIWMKESKTDVEEKIRSSSDALEEKGPDSSGDPISTEIVLETTSESQETREVSREIVEESSKEDEKEEDKSSESGEQNEVATLIKDIKPKSLQESAKQNEEFYATTTTEAREEEKLSKEETQEKEPAVHDGAESESAGILTEEKSIKEAKPEDKEEVTSYEVSLEDKGSENNQVQSESVWTEKLKGEVELKEEEPDNEEQLKSSDISPEDEGLTSIAGSVSTEIANENTFLKEVKTDDEEKIKSSDNALEEKDLKSSTDPISTEIVLETTSAGLETKAEVSRDIVEESLKEVEKEEQKSFESKEPNEVVAMIEDIKLESLEDSAKPNEDLHSKTTTEAPEEEKLAEEETQEKEPAVHDGTDLGSAGTLAEETSVKEAKQDDKEEVKSYGISLQKKGLENIQVQPESVLTENLSEETGLKEGEPDKEWQLKSCDIAPEDGLKSIVGSVSTEIVSEKTLLKEVKTDDEEKIKSYDNAFEKKDLESSDDPVSVETVSEETCMKKAKPDDEEQIKNSDAVSEEKGVSSNTDVGLELDFVSTGISNEEARVKKAEADDEEQVKSCDIATEEKGLERSVDVDVQSDFASTKIESEETDSKEAEPETVEQFKSYDVAPEEKNIEEQSDCVSNEIVCTETCLEEDKQDRGDQVNDSVVAPEEKSLASSLDSKIVIEETTEIANEEMALKEGKEDKEEHVQSRDFSLDKESLVSDADVIAKSASFAAESVSEETGVNETKRDQDELVRSSNIVLEEKSLESSLDAKIVSEEISLEEVKPDDEEQVKGSAPEKESLVTYMDAKVQSDSVSAGKESEERCLEEDKPRNEDKVRSPDVDLEESLVSEETGGKEAESDNKEKVINSDIAPEEKVGVSNVVSEVQQIENVESEEIEENKGQEVTSECEEKIEQEIKGENPIAGTENKEQDTMAETPLEDSSEDDLQDSSTVPSTEHEPVITEATERSDETTAIDKTECENANLPITEPTKEEELLQEEYDSKLESHTEKEIVNEEIQKQREEDLSALPEITSKDASPTEGHEGVEKAVENESKIEQVTDKGIDLKETQTESIEDERVYEEKDSVATVTEVVKATEADEHISSQAKETSTEENEEFAPIAPEDEKIIDEGSLKRVDDRISSREEGKIEEEVDNPCYNNYTTTAKEETTVTTSGEAQTVETDSEERNLVPAQKVEERSFDLNQVDQKEAESETIVEESHAVTEVKETELASETEDVNASKPIPAVEKLETDGIKEEIKEESECQGVKAANQGEITSEQAEKLESSATLLQKEEESKGKEETEEDIKTAHETVSKDEVNVGVSTEQVQELETSQVVKQTEDSLVEEKAEETKLKEKTEEEIRVSAIADETIENHTVLKATSKDELRVSPREEQDSENAYGSSATKTAEEACVQEEEPREITFSDETQAETKDASITVSESDSQSIAISAKEDERITCETFTESATEVQLLEQSYVLLPTEEENGITTAAKEKIEERTTEDTCSTKEVLGGDKIEDTTEASEIVSKEKSPDIEIDKDQIEQEHETAAIVKKIEEEETKEEATLSDDKTLEDSSAAKTVEEVDDVREGLNEVSKIEPQKSERSTRDADYPSVVEASNLNIEKREIASDFVSEKVESPEALTSIEEVEIIENHLKVASTDLRTEEPQRETTIQAEKTTEREILAEEELSTEISQEKGVLDVEKVHGIVQEIKQPEESSHATCKEQTPKEAEGKESLEKGIKDSDKDGPLMLTDPVEEASQRAEPNDTKLKNDNVSVNREIFEKEIKKEEYCQAGGSKTETKPAVISLSDLMQSSREETDQVAEHSAEEREETRKNGKEAEKTKTDEERDEEEEEEDDEHEHEHEETDHPDAPILVQTSKDIEPKVGRKKSHGLFSGVGSKVKHSISKVKKAITGKSSHSKTQPSG